MTSLLVSGEESPVKCGAILSPVTDFELYGNLCFFTNGAFVFTAAVALALIRKRRRSSPASARRRSACLGGLCHLVANFTPTMFHSSRSASGADVAL